MDGLDQFHAWDLQNEDHPEYECSECKDTGYAFGLLYSDYSMDCSDCNQSPEYYEAKRNPPNESEQERWEWEAKHREECAKDRLIVVPWEGGNQFHAGCTVCYFKHWTHQGGMITTTYGKAA